MTVGHNVILTFDFDFGLDHPVPEGYIYINGDLALQVGGRFDTSTISLQVVRGDS
jgi:hypothetical protein